MATEPKWPTETCGEAFADAWKQLKTERDMAQAVCEWLGEATDGHMDELERRASRRVYKGTDCGAWLRFDHQNIATLLGSIVEGSDAEVTADPLVWPFTQDEFWTTLQWVDDEASRLWDEANVDQE